MKQIALFLAATWLLGACATVENGADAISSGTRQTLSESAQSIGSGANRLRDGASESLRKARALADEGLEVEEGELVPDPFEPFNRQVFAFNLGVDTYLFAPVAGAYEAFIPLVGRSRIRDFIDNLKTPVWLANDVLQGDWDGAGVQVSRFVTNSTIGVLGFYDVAAAWQPVDLKKVDEDFGQTLGVWGADEGPYIVLPFLGPSTARDVLGLVGDNVMDPLNYADFENRTEFRVTTRALDVIDIRVQVDDAVDLVNASPDPYIQARNIYVQSRRQRLTDGRVEESFDDLPDF